MNRHYSTSDQQEVRELEDEQARKARRYSALLKRVAGKAVVHARMKAVTVEAMVCVVQSGTVKLTASQAQLRRHSIEAVDVDPAGAGVYAIVAPIQFKRDEHFAYEGKALMRDKVVF